MAMPRAPGAEHEKKKKKRKRRLYPPSLDKAILELAPLKVFASRPCGIDGWQRP